MPCGRNALCDWVSGRGLLAEYIKKQKGTSSKVRRAQVLLKADADGPCWTDTEIAEAYGCRTKTVENIRERFVTEGFELTLNSQKQKKPPCPSCWTANRRQRSLRSGLSCRRRVTPTGLSGF